MIPALCTFMCTPYNSILYHKSKILEYLTKFFGQKYINSLMDISCVKVNNITEKVNNEVNYV